MAKQPAVKPLPGAVTLVPKGTSKSLKISMTTSSRESLVTSSQDQDSAIHTTTDVILGGKEPLSLPRVSNEDSKCTKDDDRPQVVPAKALSTLGGFEEQTISSTDTSPAGVSKDQDTTAVPMDTSSSWWTPSQASPAPIIDASAGSTAAVSHSSDLEPVDPPSGVPSSKPPLPIPTLATSGTAQPTTMVTETLALSPSGVPNTILPAVRSTPENNLSPALATVTASVATTVMDASASTNSANSFSNRPQRGPLIGGVITSVVVITALATVGLIYCHRRKQRRKREEEEAERETAATAVAAAVTVPAAEEKHRPVSSRRSRSSSSASSTDSDGITECHIQQATAVRYQRCGPQAPGRQVQLSWSSGGGLGEAQRATWSLAGTARAGATRTIGEGVGERGGH